MTDAPEHVGRTTTRRTGRPVVQVAFERQLTVASDPHATWASVTEVLRLIDWIEVLEDAETVAELERYRATLADRLGMFSLRADIDIEVTRADPPTLLVARAEGEDRQVGSRITADLELRLTPTGEGTQVDVDGTYEVTGRVATLGGATIRKKADQIIADFFDNLQATLS